jgi:hypothetical protein
VLLPGTQRRFEFAGEAESRCRRQKSIPGRADLNRLLTVRAVQQNALYENVPAKPTARFALLDGTDLQKTVLQF